MPDDELAEDRKAQDEDPGPAFHVAMDHLMASTTFAARFAVGAGVDRENVARVLESLAYAIRTEDVAESMAPITLEDLDVSNL